MFAAEEADAEPTVVTQDVQDFARQAGELWQMARIKYPFNPAAGQPAHETGTEWPHSFGPKEAGFEAGRFSTSQSIGAFSLCRW